jgi:hypothetical protein
VDEAAQIATAKVGDATHDKDKALIWTKEFNQAMDRLCYNKGLFR